MIRPILRRSSSWQSLVRAAIEDENPELHQRLIEEGALVAHAADHAQSMKDQCELMTPADADEATRAQVREVAIAEMREAVRAERIDESEYGDAPADLADLTGCRWA